MTNRENVLAIALVLAFNAFLWTGAVYLIVEYNWSKWFLLLPVITSHSYKSKDD